MKPPQANTTGTHWSQINTWQYTSASTLVQIMARCLMAPSHYLSQCWLIVKGVLWHSSEVISQDVHKKLIHDMCVDMSDCHVQLHEPRIFYPSGHWPETVINAHVSDISARVWGRRWHPHTSEQKGCMLKPQWFINKNDCASQIVHTWKTCL